ncbi:MAG TPA: MOSC domain-containing protein [Terracidiphilus sp.]|jgi:MOSC domain-containing protein YiiM|nr:MOSC domain-containing protein [Terracidiphilus sp.]
MAIIENIFIGGPKALRDDRGEWLSSIARKQVIGPVRLSTEGFDGDKVTQPYHGGPEAAVCVHLVDHYEFWRERYGVNLEHGHLGENLVVNGVREEEMCAGDVVRLGSALVQISGPRVPCETQARRAGRADWVKLTIRENRTGFYLRVLEPGSVEAGDAWLLQERRHENGSIPAINCCLYLDFNPDRAMEFIQMDRLAEWWRDQFREKLARKGRHWSEDILQPDEPLHAVETEAE